MEKGNRLLVDWAALEIADFRRHNRILLLTASTIRLEPFAGNERRSHRQHSVISASRLTPVSTTLVLETRINSQANWPTFAFAILLWLDRDPGTKTIKISQFEDHKATMTLGMTSRTLSFYINTTLAAFMDDGVAASGRTLIFNINGEERSYRSGTPLTRDEDSALDCKALAPKGAVTQDRATVGGATSYLGVLELSRKPHAAFRTKESELKIAGNGWVTLKRSSEKNVSTTRCGYGRTT